VSREILKVKSIDAPKPMTSWPSSAGWSKQGLVVAAAPRPPKRSHDGLRAEKARALMRKASPESSRLQFLKDYDAKQLAMILKGESPQVLSVILPYLEPKKASSIIEGMNEDERVDLSNASPSSTSQPRGPAPSRGRP